MTVKYAVAVFWLMFDAIILTAKFVACIAIIIAYMLLGFALTLAIIWVMEIEVRD